MLLGQHMAVTEHHTPFVQQDIHHKRAPLPAGMRPQPVVDLPKLNWPLLRSRRHVQRILSSSSCHPLVVARLRQLVEGRSLVRNLVVVRIGRIAAAVVADRMGAHTGHVALT